MKKIIKAVKENSYPLHKLTEENLLFTNHIEDDRINCSVSLMDYDWMQYQIDTRFPTEDIGMLCVRFEDYGFGSARMYVKQKIFKDQHTLEIYHQYVMPRGMFDTYLKIYLLERVQYIDDTPEYAFYPGPIMIKWYNDVLENGIEEEAYDMIIDTRFAFE